MPGSPSAARARAAQRHLRQRAWASTCCRPRGAWCRACRCRQSHRRERGREPARQQRPRHPFVDSGVTGAVVGGVGAGQANVIAHNGSRGVSAAWAAPALSFAATASTPTAHWASTSTTRRSWTPMTRSMPTPARMAGRTTRSSRRARCSPGNLLQVQGTLNSTPNTTFTIDCLRQHHLRPTEPRRGRRVRRRQPGDHRCQRQRDVQPARAGRARQTRHHSHGDGARRARPSSRSAVPHWCRRCRSAASSLVGAVRGRHRSPMSA